MSEINIIAGDLGKFSWSLRGTVMDNGLGKTIDLKERAERVELLNEEKIKKLGGTAGWGITGAVLLGPLGAIGGMLIGGNKRQVAFACYLKNGKKFMATTDGKTWEKIIAVVF